MRHYNPALKMHQYRKGDPRRSKMDIRHMMIDNPPVGMPGGLK